MPNDATHPTNIRINKPRPGKKKKPARPPPSKSEKGNPALKEY
jgi:hypothetical protein